MDIPNIPPLLVQDSSPITRLANSIASPPFGYITSSLHSLPSNRDTASKSGCRSQSYTSWNVCSRSFVSSICYAGLDVVDSPLPPTPTTDHSTVSDVNGEASCSVEILQKTTRLLNASIPAPPAEPSAWSPDELPVRVVKIETESHYYERNIPISYSPVFETMEKILSGTQGPESTNHDVQSILYLTKYLQTAKGSMFEVAPLVRLGCMSLSISKHCYETEIITRRIIRGFEQTAYLGCEITQKTRRTPVSKILACTLEAFITFMINNCSGLMDPNNIFQFDQIDQEWTAVPISNTFLKSRSAVPYIASFLTSEFFNGKVNHVYRGYYVNAIGTEKSEAVIRTIPAANSVYLRGPKNIILVLVDKKNMCTNSNVKLFNFNVPVYTGAAQVNPVQFGQIWDAWWCNNMLNNIDRDVMLAMNEVEKHLAVKNAADIATSMLAELYSAAYLGFSVETNRESVMYDWEVPVNGGWSLYRNDTIARGSRAKLNYWSRADGNDQIDGRRRITGYNFSALSSWHRPSTGRVGAESQASIFPNAGKMRIWSSNVPDYKRSSIYLITTVPLMTRICFYVRLLLTHGNRVNNKNCLGSRIHLLSMIMGAETSLMFSQTELSLSVWSGYSSDIPNYPMYTLMKSVAKVATLGILILEDEYFLKLTFINNIDIFKYYVSNLFRNNDWYSYSPYPHHFVQQWSAKINTLIRKEGEITRLLDGEQHRITGILNLKDALQYCSKTVCTINADQYFPLVFYNNGLSEDNLLMAWVDNWSYLSNVSVVGDVRVNKAGLESNEFVFSLDYMGSKAENFNESIFIMLSSYTNYDTRETHFSDLEWYIPNRRR